MKQKLLTLFTLLDVVIPLTNLKLFPLDYGLVEITNTENTSISNNELRVKKNTAKFCVSTKIDGVYLKSISFTDTNPDKNGGFTCIDNNSYMPDPVENVYTYTAPNTTTTDANFQLIGSGGTAQIGTIIITVSTSDQVERLSSFGSISENKIPFTSSAATTNVELSVPASNGVATGSSRISIGSGGKHLIVSAINDKLIKYIAIPKYQQSANDITCTSTPAGTYSNNIWTPKGSSVESVDLTLTVSSTTYTQEIFVIYEDAGVTKPSFSPESGSSIIKSSGNVTITGATGNTIYYKWSTTDNEYGKSDGLALATGKDGQGTTTVNAPIPSTTGTWYLYAVANDGENYSDVVKATYTLTNQTYNISYANGGGSGEMSNTIVEEGNNQVLPANTFTRDCYSFAGWVADVNVKIGGATVTAGEIINDEATIENVTENITLIAQWTASYASGKYDFQTGATIGTSPSKTVTTTDTDYAAFQIDNLYFSAMKIGYDDGSTSNTGDGDNFNGWKLKTKDATIKFVVESDKLVTIGIGSIGSGGAAKIDYTNLDGESATASFSAGTNHNYLVKGGTLVTITHNGTNGKTVTLKKIFIQDYVPVTITAAGYATFSSTEKLDFTNVDGLTAYKATATGENSVTLEDVTGIVPANEGLLLKGAANTYYIPVSTADPTADVDGNLLQSTATAEYTVTGSEKGTAYVFGSLNEVVGFYKAATGKTIGVGKSWLLVPGTGGAKDVEFLSFVFGDEEQGETDGIKAVSTKVENGVRYNLAGQKVGADYKGIVIVNGKKVIIK